MRWTEFLTDEAERTYAITARLLDMVEPDRLNWKPEIGLNWMTTGQLLKHLSNACGQPCKGLVTGDWGLPEGTTLEDLTPEEMTPSAENLPGVSSVTEARELLIEDEFLTLRMIREAGESALEHRQFSFPWEPGKSASLGMHIFRMVQHLDRHKSQLFYYLKLQGVPMGTTDLWGN